MLLKLLMLLLWLPILCKSIFHPLCTVDKLELQMEEGGSGHSYRPVLLTPAVALGSEVGTNVPGGQPWPLGLCQFWTNLVLYILCNQLLLNLTQPSETFTVVPESSELAAWNDCPVQ